MNFYFVYQILIWTMLGLAAIVFLSLYFVKAGYGILRNGRWGKTINNKIGWFLMEAPIFIFMFALWVYSPRRFAIVPFVIFLFFEVHYFHRAFVFPFILKGKGSVPLSIIFMAVVFNTINSILQGGWLFYFSPTDYYPLSWFYSPQFILGTIFFFSGMIINIHSDQVIRSLRKEGDNKHYLPKAGIFRYVTSANYFGEILEWTGFAILTWSMAGLTFAIWTAANLVPRAHAIHLYYREKFGTEMPQNLKRVFPFIY